MEKSRLSIVIYYLLYFILFVGIVCSIFLPSLYDMFSGIDILFSEHSWIYRIAFYVCYFISLCIVLELIFIFKSIYKDTPFKKEIEKKLKLISIMFLSLSVIVIGKFIFIPTILTLAVFVVTFIVGLCFYVLAQVFKTAINYKNEIDYTV